MKIFAGVFIGGDKIRVVLANEGRILIKITSETIKIGPPEALVKQVHYLIELALEKISAKEEDLIAIGTSSAGPFVGGISISAPNICGFEGKNDWTVIPYIGKLAKLMGIEKKYKLANDVYSSLNVEHLFGNAQGISNAVFIRISMGVGTGIIIDGHLLEGKGKNAGHFGHTIVKKNGALCRCGQRGCIETILSSDNMIKRAKHAGLILDNNVVGDIYDLYKNGDADAVKLITKTIEYLGIFLINIINVTDTELILLGGSAVENHMDLILPALEEYILRNSMVVLSEGTQIKIPQLQAYIEDLAGLSLVIPKNWIETWKKKLPWYEECEEIFIGVEEIVKKLGY